MPHPLKFRPLAPDEAARLDRACRTPREKRVVWTLLDTGLRLAELAALTRDQTDFEGRCLRVPHGSPGNAGRPPRVIPLSPRTEAVLTPWFGKHERFGLSARMVQLMISDAAMRAGMGGRVCAEALRHTFAVSAVRNGVSPLGLQRLLGLQHLAATEVYFALAREEMAQAR